MRFCKRLGFAGYKEFQRELIAELALLGDKKDIALEDISMDDSVERIVGKVMKSNVRTIEATARTLDYTVLERCAAVLSGHAPVNLFGIGASRLVAHDLAQKLMRVDKECHLYDDWHDQLLCAKNMHEGDMAIAFSYSGLTQEVLGLHRRGSTSQLSRCGRYQSRWIIQACHHGRCRARRRCE